MLSCSSTKAFLTWPSQFEFSATAWYSDLSLQYAAVPHCKICEIIARVYFKKGKGPSDFNMDVSLHKVGLTDTWLQAGDPWLVL